MTLTEIWSLCASNNVLTNTQCWENSSNILTVGKAMRTSSRKYHEGFTDILVVRETFWFEKVVL